MPYRNKEQQLKYQRDWISARRNKWFNKHGPCVICGSKDNLELHHKDPTKKISHRIWSWSWSRIEEETKDCEVRCFKCHHLIHDGSKESWHGTSGGYSNHGCRCIKCVEANKLKCKEYRRNKRGHMYQGGDRPLQGPCGGFDSLCLHY